MTRKEYLVEYRARQKQHRKEYMKVWNQQHKEQQLAYQAKKKERIRTYLNNLKHEAGCHICGENDHRCLDFHHRDPNEKSGHLSTALKRQWSIARINAEIAKCDVICSNCHRKLHYEEQGRHRSNRRSCD